LSLNGFPAYVADIQFIDVEDEEGNFDFGFYRIHIPAILNPGTDQEKEIQFTFRFNDGFDHELESIMRERYGDTTLVTGKDRIRLQPGDQVQLEYEIFDVETNEAFFVPEPGAIIEIVNGNEDIDLQHIQLPEGRYHLGFVVMDHFQNDTLIYDPTVHVVTTVDTDDPLREEMTVTLSPNPAASILQVQFSEVVSGTLELHDLLGRPVLTRKVAGVINTDLDISTLASGTYWLRLRVGDRFLSQKVVKP
jgi:5-hydroxyisourate hydrolase-like protein (transthyretin family)